MSVETEPQMKRTELVSSQAQSLTKKYQETKEILQLQELKKRNMQAQLGLSLSHWPAKEPYLSDTKKPATSEVCPSNSIQKTVSFMLQDSEGKIRELESLIDASEPLTLRELIKLMHSHSECVWVESPQGQERNESVGEMTQKLLESLKNQQEVENETVRKSFEKAGDSIRDYEARLLTMEDMLGRVHRQKMESSFALGCSREEHPDLSQQVELIASENLALNQCYQEIVNQLREADREIDRLKAELCRLRSSQQYPQSNVDQDQDKKETSKKNVYERELHEKSQKLQEALIKLETIGNNLKDTEKRLQLKEATLRGLGFQVAESENNAKELDSETDDLKRQLEVLGSKLSEKDKQLQNAEQVCRELHSQNAKYEETARMCSQMLVDVQEEIRMLKEKAGTQGTFGSEPGIEIGHQELMQNLTNEGIIEEVVEEFKSKSKSLNHLLDMLVKGSKIDLSDTGMDTNILDENQAGMMEMFERMILHKVLAGLEDCQKGSEVEQALSNVVERMLVDSKLLLVMNKLSNLQELQSDAKPASCTEKSAGYGNALSEETMKSNVLYRLLDDAANPCVMKTLAEVIQKKVVLLNQTVSALRERTNEEVHSLALTLSICGSQRTWSEYVREAIMDITCMYLVVLQILPRTRPLDLSVCANCADLRAQLTSEKQVMSSVQSPISVAHIQIEGEPIDSLDKAILLQDTMAKHKKELRELKEAYEQEAEKVRLEVAKAGEALRLRSEENVKEIDSLTVCMENLKKQHGMERKDLIAHFNQEMEELTDAVGPAEPGTDSEPNSTSLKVRIQKLVSRLSELTEEMNLRARDGDVTLLRLKYQKDLESLKVKEFRVLAVLRLY